MHHRVGLVRVTGEHDDRLVVSYGVLVDFEVLVENLLLIFLLCLDSLLHCGFGCLFVNAELLQIFHARVLCELLVREVECRCVQRHVGVDVVEHFGICRNDRAVEAVV